MRFVVAFLDAITTEPPRLAIFVLEGEFMMTRTEATRFFVKPKARPISSAVGTGLRMTYVIDLIVLRISEEHDGTTACSKLQ